MFDLFTSTEMRRLRHLEARIEKMEKLMALNFDNLHGAVSSLSEDVKALVALYQAAAANPAASAADQGVIDAVTQSLAALDAAVKATGPAAAPSGAPAPAAAPTGTAAPAA